MKFDVFYGKEHTDCIEWASKKTRGESGMGLALEFGVAGGRTLDIISKDHHAVGFDSFEGLPEDWRDGFPKGMFAGPVPTIQNAEIVVGWFEDTLPKWIDQNKDRLSSLELIHVDCDLYSSTVTVLENLKPWIKSGLYIVFDEYHGYPGYENHEARAWENFTEENEISSVVRGIGPEQLVVEIL